MQTFTNDNGAEILLIGPAELPLFLAELNRQPRSCRDDEWPAPRACRDDEP